MAAANAGMSRMEKMDLPWPNQLFDDRASKAAFFPNFALLQTARNAVDSFSGVAQLLRAIQPIN
jgi:hypothetical protein